MKSLQGFFFAFIVFGLIGSINFGFPFQDKNEFSLHVNARNDGDDDLRRLYGWDDNDPIDDDESQDLDDVSVRAYIPELGIMFASSPFDLDDHNIHSKILHGYSDESLCGQWVRISVGNDEVRRTKYRPILC